MSPGQRHPAPAASAGAAPPPAADRGPPDDHAVQEVGEPAVAGDVGEVREAPLRGQERASDCDGRQVCRKQRAPAPRPGCGRALTTSAPGSREQVAWAAPATLRHPRAPLPCDGGGCPGTATPDPPPATTRSPQLPPPHGSEPPAEFRGPRRGASRVTGLTSSLKPMCIPQSSMTFLPAMETRMQLRPTSWPAPAGATGQVLPNPSLPSGPPHPRRALGGAGHDPRLLWGHVRRGSRHLRTLTGEGDARGGDKVPSPPGRFRRECPPPLRLPPQAQPLPPGASAWKKPLTPQGSSHPTVTHPYPRRQGQVTGAGLWSQHQQRQTGTTPGLATPPETSAGGTSRLWGPLPLALPSGGVRRCLCWWCQHRGSPMWLRAAVGKQAPDALR